MTTGPIHHLIVFIILGFALLKIFKKSKIIFFVYLLALPLIGEYIQPFIPLNFNFEYMDIVWNYVGILLPIPIYLGCNSVV